ncbi:Ig-like domain-containing protein [Curtobacterium sp. MCBD17_008]|uniref:Ig-like domain-containing protein n=1 Tax=Curtobacterium sp. MCBD17_008 TaxID=2175656 RepID=UPI000DAA145B|nr:Ig-like domain-containing protein [Curtobacterium sp. MCBD17_008]PZE91679.1 hypothetical protein DEI95_09890 [Curtobacterium sp. MCBD17_008]
MGIKTIAMAVTAVIVSALMGAGPAAAAAAPEAPPGSTRTIANKPTGVGLIPVDDRTYQVTGQPHCGLFDSTCQIHVGNVGGDYHWDGGTSTATFAGWRYGETRTPQFWTYACALWCANSAKVNGTPVTRPYPKRPITAEVASQSDAGRSAYITGTASGKASIRLNGRQVATASDAGTGTWATTVTGLSVGQNTLVFQQYVDGQYRDQTSVTVTITEPSKPGRIIGNDDTAELQRGGSTTVYARYTAQSAFTTPTGTLVLTAPEGTTFATGQDHQRGQYLDGSTWREFGGDSLVSGVRSADGHTYSFTLGNRNWDVAAGQQFRFAMQVETPVGITSTTGALTGALTGSVAAGSFDTTATVTTTVMGEAFTAAATFPGDITKPVVVSGRGQPGAQVEVRDGDRVLASTTVGLDGSWSVTVAAPDRGGVLAVRAVQRVQGEDTDAVGVDLDYGTAVRISSPGDGYHTNPVFSRVRIVGVAEPGSVVRVGERGGAPDGLGRVDVGAEGRWAVTTPALGVGEHVVVATATSKGANTTNSSVRVIVDDE